VQQFAKHMSSARKKVIVRRFLGDTLPGYLLPSGFVRNQGTGRVIELLDLSGRVLELPLAEVKHICYVREFNLNDNVNPERLARRTFLARPRTEGLWIRLNFRTPSTTEVDQLEGLAPIDATLLNDILNDAGLFLIPPDVRSNTQRIYVPRAAISELQLLAVITTPSRRKPLPATPAAASAQKDLFDSPLPPNTRPN
jgi:hypothetical protein